MGLRFIAQRTVCASIVARVVFVEDAMALNTSLEGAFVCVVCVCARMCMCVCTYVLCVRVVCACVWCVCSVLSVCACVCVLCVSVCVLVCCVCV